MLSKLVFLREFTRKILGHIEYFEHSSPLAHEVYSRLVAIQEDFGNLFDQEEVRIILELGQCPVNREDDMRALIRIACGAAQKAWASKMVRNQDMETIEIFQMLAVFDPSQKAAFTFTTDEILTVLRPIHDSIYGPTEANYDPLRVLFFIFQVLIL